MKVYYEPQCSKVHDFRFPLGKWRFIILDENRSETKYSSGWIYYSEREAYKEAKKYCTENSLNGSES